MNTARALRDRFVTEAEFLALPESMERVELIDGEIIVSPSPSVFHQATILALLGPLRAWASSQDPRAFVGLSPLDVRLAPGRIVQPDLFVVRAGLPKDAATPLDVVPDLAIEVLSTRPSYDRLAKRALYAECGVPEYWIVDPEQGTVEVVCGHERVEVARETLASPTLAGLAVDLLALFAEVR